MDNPIILTSLNGFLGKKDLARLKAVNKLTKYYIFPKSYRNSMLKLNTSVLAILQMIAFSPKIAVFKDVKTWNIADWAVYQTYWAYLYYLGKSDYDVLEKFFKFHQFLDTPDITETVKEKLYQIELKKRVTIYDYYDIFSIMELEDLECLGY